MTTWNKLLVTLDEVFGFQDKIKSTVKKKQQHFDQETQEHVFLIEYRVMRGERAKQKKRKDDSVDRRVNKKKIDSLLQDINRLV